MKKILGNKANGKGQNGRGKALLDQDVYVELPDGTASHHQKKQPHSGSRHQIESQTAVACCEEEKEYWAKIPEGYGWDVCIVVPYDPADDIYANGPNFSINGTIGNDLEQGMDKYSPDHVSFTQIIERLYQADLQTSCFKSGDGDEIYIKVRASLYRLAEHAADSGWDMLLDPLALRDKIDNQDAPIEDDHETTPLTPYQCIYASFDDERPEIFAHAPGYQHPFSDLLRIKMIFDIITSNKIGCAHLNLRKMKSDDKDPKKCSVVAYYPLHNRFMVDDLESRWLNWRVRPWEQPLDDVKEYFGEKIALYFCFTAHYTTWLLPLSIAGSAVCLDIIIESAIYDSFNEALLTGYTIPFFCIFVSFWSQLMIEFWKRTEATKAMEWGMTHFEDEESERPEFEFDEIKRSLINGSEIHFFDPRKKLRRLMHSFAVIFSMVLLVIACVSGIFGLQYYFNSSKSDVEASDGNTAVSILSAVQITILAMVYNNMAIQLTDQENHRTDTEYDDALIAKLFAFSFINSYASLFFIAFIKWNLGEACVGPCLAELAYQLAIIFGTKLTVDKISTYLTLKVNQYLANRAEENEYEEARKKGIKVRPPGPIELERRLPEYDASLDVLGDYGQIFIQYGYVTLFVAACPIAPIMAYVSNLIEIRADGHKLLHIHRRVIPMGAQDVGTWLVILQLTAVIAVVTNAGLLCYTMQLITFTNVGKTWLFIGLQYAILVMMMIFAYVVNDEPAYVTIQKERQDYLEERLNMTEEEVAKEKEKAAKRKAHANHHHNDSHGESGKLDASKLDLSLFQIHEEDISLHAKKMVSNPVVVSYR